MISLLHSQIEAMKLEREKLHHDLDIISRIAKSSMEYTRFPKAPKTDSLITIVWGISVRPLWYTTWSCLLLLTLTDSRILIASNFKILKKWNRFLNLGDLQITCGVT